MRVLGKIMIDTASDATIDEVAGKMLEVEMYLNNEIAVKVFRKFGVLLRVHLKGEEKK
jgi:hypothetical protein